MRKRLGRMNPYCGIARLNLTLHIYSFVIKSMTWTLSSQLHASTFAVHQGGTSAERNCRQSMLNSIKNKFGIVQKVLSEKASAITRMRQKCVKNAPKWVFSYWEKRNIPKCVRNARKMRQKCACWECIVQPKCALAAHAYRCISQQLSVSLSMSASLFLYIWFSLSASLPFSLFSNQKVIKLRSLPPPGRSVNFEDFPLIRTVFPHFGPFSGGGGVKPNFCGQDFFGHPDFSEECIPFCCLGGSKGGFCEGGGNQGAAKGGRIKEFDHFCRFRDSFGRLLVTFSDVFLSFFRHFFFAKLLLPDSFCGRVRKISIIGVARAHRLQ